MAEGLVSSAVCRLCSLHHAGIDTGMDAAFFGCHPGDPGTVFSAAPSGSDPGDTGSPHPGGHRSSKKDGFSDDGCQSVASRACLQPDVFYSLKDGEKNEIYPKGSYFCCLRLGKE